MELSDIFTQEFRTDIQDSFAVATGFGVVFVDKEGNHLDSGGNFCKFCHAVNETPEGRRACALSNKHAIELALETHQPGIYICHAGLVNIEVPLVCAGEFLGAITAGQVLCDDMDAYPHDNVAGKMAWLSNPEYAAYYNEIEVISRKKIEATTRALFNISNYIVQTADYNQSKQALLLSEKRQIELEHQLRLAELDELQKQVAPHFIFNVLSGISRMIAMEEYGTATKMLDSFAQMMRYRLSDIHSHVTLEQEMAYIDNYLSIQQLRFGRRIRYSIRCDEVLKDMQIPFFSLQQLVENSIEHGLLELEHGGEVTLDCRRHNGYDEIVLKDNGVGIAPLQLRQLRQGLAGETGRVAQGHVGLYNSARRLRLQYGDRLRFILDSKPGAGTSICIQV